MNRTIVCGWQLASSSPAVDSVPVPSQHRIRQGGRPGQCWRCSDEALHHPTFSIFNQDTIPVSHTWCVWHCTKTGGDIFMPIGLASSHHYIPPCFTVIPILSAPLYMHSPAPGADIFGDRSVSRSYLSLLKCSGF